MLTISTPTLTPRLRYAFETITQLWGLSTEVSFMDHRGGVSGPTLHYGPSPIPHAINVPSSGFLTEMQVRDQFAPWRWDEQGELQLFPTDDASGFDLGFDLPAATCYLLSGYECYVEPHLDAHGRYDLAAYPSAQWRLDAVPWVHRWAELLWDKLAVRSPRLQRVRPSYRIHYTVDVDAPWKHRHKGMPLEIGGLMRALLHGRIRSVQERLRSVVLGQDPYYTFDQLESLLPADQTTFFALIARHSPYDTRYTWRHQPYRQLLRRLSEKGYAIGIHPSYTSYLDGARIQEEVDRLQEIIDQPVRMSRQHFLRYRLPDTFRHLIAAGITDDHTLCRYDLGGFPHGMAKPFRWFDLLANDVSSLTLHPTQLMDRTMQQYMGLSPSEATHHAQQLVDTTKQYGGTCTLLLHNDSLSESGEWRGWREPINQVIRLGKDLSVDAQTD